MRARLTVGALVVFDVTLLEVEADEEPGAVHDVSTHHSIGFSAPAGWREPVEGGGGDE